MSDKDGKSDSSSESEKERSDSDHEDEKGEKQEKKEKVGGNLGRGYLFSENDFDNPEISVNRHSPN